MCARAVQAAVTVVHDAFAAAGVTSLEGLSAQTDACVETVLVRDSARRCCRCRCRCRCAILAVLAHAQPLLPRTRDVIFSPLFRHTARTQYALIRTNNLLSFASADVVQKNVKTVVAHYRSRISGRGSALAPLGEPTRRPLHYRSSISGRGSALAPLGEPTRRRFTRAAADIVCLLD